MEAFCASIDEQIEEKKKGSHQLTQPICNRFLIANNNARRWLDSSSSLALKRIRGDCCKGPQTDRYVGGGGGGGGGTIESSSGSIRREVRLLRLSQSHTRERLS